MITVPRFEYAQARIQSRYGQRPTEALWQQLEATRELSSYLEGARVSVLAPWVATISRTSDAHAIEKNLRDNFCTTVDEISGWVPNRWRPSVLWVQTLLGLPALQHLLAGEAPLNWMQQDSRLQPYLLYGADDSDATEPPEEIQSLLGGMKEELPLEEAWLQVWRHRWPRHGKGVSAPLEGLTALVRDHLDRFASLVPEEGWPARRTLHRQLQGFFRHHALHPAAIFAYLALLSLDLERLRDGLVRRALFTTGKDGQ